MYPNGLVAAIADPEAAAGIMAVAVGTCICCTGGIGIGIDIGIGAKEVIGRD